MSIPSKSVGCYSENDNELRRGPWTLEEDDMLIKYIANHGEGRWNLLAMSSGLRRTGKSCRLRWLNYLRPDVKRGNFTTQEKLLIFELHSKWGNRWSKIAQQLPGRTDNEIKNYWRTRIQKHASFIDRTGFLEIAKRLQMIRCLQKAKESSSSAVSIQNQAIPLPLDGVSHYSVVGTIPTQIPCHGSCITLQNHLHEHNSDSDHSNGSCISSSESANIPNMTLGYTKSQFQALDNSDFSSCAYDGYQVNNNVYEMDGFNLTTTMVAEDLEFPMDYCQMSESNCLNKEFAYGWNMDELWQFRNIQK